jgi:hypothetical protein
MRAREETVEGQTKRQGRTTEDPRSEGADP